MHIHKSDRSLEYLMHKSDEPPYDDMRIVSQSSVMGNYEDAWDRPFSSYLRVGNNHHLNREEVAQLVAHLNAWLATGSLELKDK